MPRGGFALRLRHKLVCQDKGLICLRLESTPESEAIYPWRFAVKTTYALKGNHISCRMKVLNYDRKTMYFQCGFLTAFNCPFVSGTTQADYGLRLEQLEALTVQEQDDNGFLTRNTQMWEPEDGVIFLDSGKLDSGLVIREPTSQYFQKERGICPPLYTGSSLCLSAGGPCGGAALPLYGQLARRPRFGRRVCQLGEKGKCHLPGGDGGILRPPDHRDWLGVKKEPFAVRN